MRRKQIPKTSGGDDVNIYEEDESKGEGRHALSALISSVGLLIPSPRGVEVSTRQWVLANDLRLVACLMYL